MPQERIRNAQWSRSSVFPGKCHRFNFVTVWKTFVVCLCQVPQFQFFHRVEDVFGVLL